MATHLNDPIDNTPGRLAGKSRHKIYSVEKEYVLFIFLFVWSTTDILASEDNIHKTQQLKIDSNGLVYEYQSHPVSSSTGEKLYDTGQIKITKVSTKELVFFQETQQSPGCEGFPSISTLPAFPSEPKLDGEIKDEKLVLLCGSTGGPHQTLFIFNQAPLGLQVSAIDFYNNKVNITFDKQLGGYLSLVTRRSINPELFGISPYPTLYKFHDDASSAGFIPVFGGESAERYYGDFYRQFLNRENANIQESLGPVVASLLATKNRNIICNGKNELLNNGIDSKEIEIWINKFADTQYGNFDLTLCSRR